MKTLLILIAFLFVSCTVVQNSNYTLDLNKVSYVKDLRTGLCFAYTTSETYGSLSVFTMTCVPCNAEVDSLISRSK